MSVEPENEKQHNKQQKRVKVAWWGHSGSNKKANTEKFEFQIL